MKTADTEIHSVSKRMIGSIDGSEDGPYIILVAGIHGNEGAGVEAVEHVMEHLSDRAPCFKGNIVAVRGNIRALDRGVRFIDEDMNRLWFPAILDEVRATAKEDMGTSERREMKDLLSVIDRIRKMASQPAIFVDVHTFSADGALFTLPSHRTETIQMLSQMYVPVVEGIADALQGTTLKYYGDQGMISFALEGGQHHSSETCKNIIASIMLMLEQLGCISGERMPGIEKYRTHLRSYTQNLPAKAKLVYQHIIHPGDHFEMQPGYQNFQRIKEGEWLATDRDGKILAQCDGYMLMPLYQKQGNDGFFIVRESDG